jgi:protein-S-isoprenylcysteine O-methyltransferase Ste14
VPIDNKITEDYTQSPTSWLFLLLAIVYTSLGFIYAGSEERMCLEKYGDAYREYMERTPRWIGLPKS